LNQEKLGSDLSEIVGDNRVSTELYERRLYEHDLAPLPTEIGFIFKTTPDAVVKPKNTAEISEIIKYANENRIPIVPRGTSSWGFGGTIPTKGGIVLEVNSLREIKDLDTDKMTVNVGAGVRWSKLLDYLEEEGYTFPVYPSSAPSGTVGGWMATGGLGIGSLKYGPLIDLTNSITVVTPTGEIRNLNRDDGEDFEKYFQSEGTLGVITQAKLMIKRKPERIHPVLTAFNDYDTLTEVIEKSMLGAVLPFFIEIQDREYLDIKRSIGMHAPIAQVVCLFVYEGTDNEVSKSEKYLKSLISEASGTLLSQKDAEEDWEGRFYYMRIKKAGPTLLAGEVTFPLPNLGFVVEETGKVKEKHSLKLGIKAFMVAPDTVLFMPMFLSDERRRWKYLSTLPIINEITHIGFKAGGRPYGFGIWNAFFLEQVYGKETVQMMKERKKREDPNNIMNPGKHYKVITRYGIPLWGTAFRIFTSLLGILKYF